MNEMLKKLLSLLLSTVLVLSLLPLTAFGADDGEEAGNEDEWQFVPGDIPEEVEYGYPDDEYQGIDRGSIPANYDGRKYVTPVKDQNPYGLCWTFASLGALEANMKKNGMGTFDFSEAHMAYATATYTYGGKTVNADQGFRTDPLSGGNRSYASAYLMRGTTMSGTVNESDDKYTSINGDSPNRNPSITESKTKTYSVHDVIFLTGNEKATTTEAARIKNAIMTYGSVAISMHWPDGSGYGEPVSNYLNYSTGALYYNGSKGTNHAVLLVGWDDNYSKSKFVSGRQPSKNGAWLVKNSWGSDWCNDGYFWLSYEDASAPVRAAVYSGAAKWNPSTDYVYESDYKCRGAGNGYDESGGMFAKVYPVKKSGQTVTSVRVFIPNAESGSVTLSADIVSSFSSFSGYSFKAKGSRTVNYPGWYTIDLNTPVKLGSSGSKFAVVVKMTGATYMGYDDSNSLPSGVSAYSCSLSGTLSSVAKNFAIKAVATTAATSSASLSVKFVDNEFKAVITAPANSVLIAASYDSSGRQVAVKTFTYTSAVTNKTVSTGLKKTSGYTYKAMLVSKDTFVPLCAAKSIKG